MSRMNPETCPHDHFEASVNVQRVFDKPGGVVTDYIAHTEVKCKDCATPFYFVGLPIVNLKAPMTPARLKLPFRTYEKAFLPIRPLKQ